MSFPFSPSQVVRVRPVKPWPGLPGMVPGHCLRLYNARLT